MTSLRSAPLACALAMVVAGGTAGTAQPINRLRVVVDAGPIVGRVDAGVARFWGVPYAQPPVGPLRWRPPQPVTPWLDDRETTAFGRACPQATPGDMVDGGTVTTGEDCLTLNIWAPVPAASRPVMVWLHGGGNTQGAGFRRYYDGAAFARDQVILVTLNYRLGPLGFFAHPALTGEAARDEPLGNYLLLDQIAALRWVHANIGKFGGDPANVTLFGESAGAVDALDLMTVPAAAGLFQKVIAESAGFVAHSVTLAAAEAEGRTTAGAAGEAAAAPSAARLRDLSADALAKIDVASGGPVVDGRLMKESPIQAFAAGRFQRVPLVIGTNSDEASLLGDAVAAAEVLNGFSPSDLAVARAAYGGALSDVELAKALFRDVNFAAPSRWIAAQVSATGTPAFLYRFAYQRRSQRGRMAGAGHGAEIPYVFDSWRQAPTGGSLLPAEDRDEAARVHAYWVAFAQHHVPAYPAGPDWPSYSASADVLLDFAVTTAAGPVPDRAALAFAETHFVPRTPSRH